MKKTQLSLLTMFANVSFICVQRRAAAMEQPSGVPAVVHRHVCRPRQRVAVPHHGLRERGRRLPHPLPRGAHVHRPGEEDKAP